MGKAHKLILVMIVTMLTMATLAYPFCLYSNGSLISQYRTLYIETAMSTLSHQWLATAFIPSSIIDEVMRDRQLSQEAQEDKQTTQTVQQTVYDLVDDQSSPIDQFMTVFHELDRESVLAYLREHPDTTPQTIAFDLADAGDAASGIITTAGDEVLALDTANGIFITRVTGRDYEGRLAFVKNASEVSVGVAKALFSHGQFVGEIADRYDATLAINASGFEDPDGNGNGGTPYGYVKTQGIKKRSAVAGNYKIIGFDDNNLLRIGKFDDTTAFRDAVEFTPALIIDGEQLVRDSSGWGLQPRSAIAQTDDGTVLFLVVDGRQFGYSLGCTVNECADIFMRYDATQAANLDGGSSSIMYYNGREITRPTTASRNKEGRYLPNAFIVRMT